MCFLEVINQSSKKLQDGINNAVREDIDKYMYEVFALKKIYFECLEVLQDQMGDE